MTKLTPKRKPILRIVLLLIIAIPVLFIVAILVSIYIVSPISESVDKAKFDALDTKSKALYANINAVSGGAEMWTYKAHCEEWMTGDWPTGEYQCSTTMSTEVKVTNVSSFVALHDKYYPIIDRALMLKPAGELAKNNFGEFGIRFVVSSAEKEYTIVNENGLGCRYLASLDQAQDGTDIGYGLAILGGVGNATISLECSDKALGNWYK